MKATQRIVVALVDALKKFEGSNHMGLLLLIVFFLAEPLISILQNIYVGERTCDGLGRVT